MQAPPGRRAGVIMLKTLIIGADSVAPDIIFQNKELFPILAGMIDKGASASYSAYVQKGYNGSYSSEQNWASIYTGLEPWKHEITTYKIHGEKRRPRMSDFSCLKPFWEMLNNSGLKTGLWAADCCTAPVEVNGYTVSVRYDLLETPVDRREVKRELQVNDKDKALLSCLEGEPPERLYPRTLLQQGYTFEQLKSNADLAEEVIHKYCFQDALPNFEEELEYWFHSIQDAQKRYPVDVLYLFTPTTDLIAHCCMSCDQNSVLISAYQILDHYIGKLVEELNPEITVFLSDHGQQNFKDLIQCSNPEIQREAFAARDEVLWLKNGYIAFEAHNGALLFTAHALKGTFIVSGKGIQHTTVKEMRTLDIYPTLLELFGIKVPENRSGYVADIFARPILNHERLLRPDSIKRRSIALIQSHAVSVMDIILNELYIENRFADIIVVGEERYKEIFQGNPRVAGFIPFEQYRAEHFDAVYCGIYDENSKLMRHIQVFERNGE